MSDDTRNGRREEGAVHPLIVHAVHTPHVPLGFFTLLPLHFERQRNEVSEGCERDGKGANRGRWVTVRPQPKDRKIEILLPLVYLRLFTLLLILSSLRLVRYASEPTEEVRRSSETRRG